MNVGNLISCTSSFSKPSLDIWKFLFHIMLMPSIQDFKHDLTSMGNECNCPMVSIFFSITLLGNWDEYWHFPVLWPLLGLPDLLTYWMLKLMSIESMIACNHLVLCCFLPSVFPSIRVFSNRLALHIRWPNYWNFSFSISPSNEYSGLIPTALISLLSKGFSRIFSSTIVQKHQLFSAQPSLESSSHIHTWLLVKP